MSSRTEAERQTAARSPRVSPRPTLSEADGARLDATAPPTVPEPTADGEVGKETEAADDEGGEALALAAEAKAKAAASVVAQQPLARTSYVGGRA